MATLAVQDSEGQPKDMSNLKGRIVNARIDSISEQTSKFYRVDEDDPNSPMKPEMLFTFLATDPLDGDESFVGTKFFGNTGVVLSNHSNCKLYNWCCAALGVGDITPGYELDLDDLVGEPCKIQLTVSKNGNPRVQAVLRSD